MLSSSSKFFADYFTNCRFIERLFAFRKIFSKCFVDHCLVTVTRLIGSFPEIIEDVRVKVHCHPRFTLGGYNLASFGFFKIMFLFHIVSFAMASPLIFPSLDGRGRGEGGKGIGYHLSATGAGIPYQTLINLYQRDCAASGRKPSIEWREAS
jgi:hypothetical protein